jgi:hypothetical protein
MLNLLFRKSANQLKIHTFLFGLIRYTNATIYTSFFLRKIKNKQIIINEQKQNRNKITTQKIITFSHVPDWKQELRQRLVAV